MRALLGLAFLTSTAFACPDISGKYAVCNSSTGETENLKDIVIEQKIINGFCHGYDFEYHLC